MKSAQMLNDFTNIALPAIGIFVLIGIQVKIIFEIPKHVKG